MRIQHNISAMYAARQYETNNDAVSKNIQKLSSGYRINSAADDAAGLAISEKMRGQIRGLDQAQNNAQDGISLIQTAEGGLNETQSILQRMRELAVQSSNGTYQDDVDRENLNKEFQDLTAEIDRISNSTAFNKINLLDGSLSGSSSSTSTSTKVADLEFSDVAKANGGYAVTSTKTGTYSADAVSAIEDNTTNSYTVTYTAADGTQKSATISLSYDGDATVTGSDPTAPYDVNDSDPSGDTALLATDFDDVLKSELGKTDLAKDFDIDVTDGAVTFTAKVAGSKGSVVTGFFETDDVENVAPTAVAHTVATDVKGEDTYESITANVKMYDGADTSNADDYTFEVNGQKFAYVTNAAAAAKLDSDVNYVVADIGDTDGDGDSIVDVSNADATAMAALITQKTGINATVATSATSIDFKPSDNTEVTSTNGGVIFQIGANGGKDQQVSLQIGDMSAKGLKLTGANISTLNNANEAIDVVDAAINQVSGTRADLGALQNRLQYTVDNLSTSSENLTAAESRIRDVDMASEMVEMTKNNILSQAAQAMLAQANTQPQGVLQLLR